VKGESVNWPRKEGFIRTGTKRTVWLKRSKVAIKISDMYLQHINSVNREASVCAVPKQTTEGAPFFPTTLLFHPKRLDEVARSSQEPETERQNTDVVNLS
jgi:hypothetical protein